MEFYIGDYSEIVDLTCPSLWSPVCHEEFPLNFRKSVRSMLLAVKRYGTIPPVFVLDSLGLCGGQNQYQCVGVAYAIALSNEEEELGPRYVLYVVTSEGKVFLPADPEVMDVPFTSSDGSMPPETTSPEAHRNYVKTLNIQDHVFLYPELFCPEARRRSFEKARARAFLRQAALLYEEEEL